MFDNILLTIDLNHKASWVHALPQAVALTQASGGRLHVMSVVPDFGMPVVEGFFPADYGDKAMAKARKELVGLVADHVPREIKVETHVAYGAIHDEVLAAIKRTGADLVVMASHSPDRVREFLVGSHADRIVRRSPVSVLVVRR